MVQSEVAQAFQQRQAQRTPDLTPIKQALIGQIKAALPAVAVALKQNGFPDFANKLYSAGPVMVDGEERYVWKFRSDIMYANDSRVRGGRRDVGFIELGVLLVEQNGQVSSAVIVVSTDPAGEIFCVCTDDDLMQLRPDRLGAIFEVLVKLQEQPKPPVWHIPDI